MSSLILSFQNQLSSVMETILNSAIQEITELAKKVLVEEVLRSHLELDALKHQLQIRGECMRCATGFKEEAADAVPQLTGKDITDVLREQTESVSPQTDASGSNETRGAPATTAPKTHLEEPRDTERQKEEHIPTRVYGRAVKPRAAVEELIHMKGLRDSGSSGPLRDVHDHGEEMKTPTSSQKRKDNSNRLACRPQSTEQRQMIRDNMTHLWSPSVKLEGNFLTTPIKQETKVTPVWDGEHRGSPEEMVDSAEQDPREIWEPEEIATNSHLGVSHFSLSQLQACHMIHNTSKTEEQGSGSNEALCQISGVDRISSYRCLGVSEECYDSIGMSDEAWARQRSHSYPHRLAEKPYGCKVCGKTFLRPNYVKEHLRTHTGEKPFPCTQCGRAFAKLCNMLTHRQSHSGERPYTCVHCGKRFTLKKNLKRHLLCHH